MAALMRLYMSLYFLYTMAACSIIKTYKLKHASTKGYSYMLFYLRNTVQTIAQ